MKWDKKEIQDYLYTEWLYACRILAGRVRQLPNKPWRKWFDANMSAGAAVTKAYGKSWRKLPGLKAGDPGINFLENLFDSKMNLLPEYRGSKTYWLYHDNYLAAKLLEKVRPDLSERIRREIKRYGVTESGKIEILFGESAHPLPFRNYHLTSIAHVGDKIVRTEIVTDMVSVGWRKYADLLFLYAIAQPDPYIARRAFYGAFQMWNGEGFYDAVAAHTGIFATYKLALYIIAARRLGIEPLPQIVARLRSMQNKEGGWVTDYEPGRRGKSVGFANVETTCLALLALGDSPT